MDFFVPSIAYNLVADPFDFEEESDIYTTWRGLSSVGAEELYNWAQVYQTVIK
jgi:hypothetical protein